MSCGFTVLASKGPLRREEFVQRNALKASLDGVVTKLLDPLPALAVCVAVVRVTERLVVTGAPQAASQGQADR